MRNDSYNPACARATPCSLPSSAFPLALHAAPGYPVSTQQSSASRARVEAAGAAMDACPELCPAEVAGQSQPPLSMLEESHARRPHRPGPVLSRSDGVDEPNSRWPRRQHSAGGISRTYTTVGLKHSLGIL